MQITFILYRMYFFNCRKVITYSKEVPAQRECDFRHTQGLSTGQPQKCQMLSFSSERFYGLPKDNNDGLEFRTFWEFQQNYCNYEMTWRERFTQQTQSIPIWFLFGYFLWTKSHRSGKQIVTVAGYESPYRGKKIWSKCISNIYVTLEHKSSHK